MVGVFSEEICARAFDLGTPRANFVFAGRGQTNPLGVLRLETDQGAFAIKRFTVPPRPAALAIESAAFTGGVPMPRPVQTTSGEPAATYQTNSGLVWVRAYSWIEGEPGDWGRVSEGASFEVGQLMARVHALSVAPEVLVEEPWQPPGGTGWRVLAEAASAAGHAWAELLFEKIPLLVEAERGQTASLNERTSPSQRDYHPPNLITPAVGPRVLVDWDAAGAAVARTEAFKFAVIWATPEGERPERELVQAFLRGYRAAGGLLEPPSMAEIVRLAQPNAWWIWFNVNRDLSDDPGPDPELVPALLSGLQPIDIAGLTALFR
jgi:Ser/Thr protein kinase RdoA (MazF antagonist)